ncbi:MAG TPA: phenylalanine--tRNA ligase subunit beta, partial [Bacteroidia bacterium]|nr:phenylalanine--tRNA ligase subunit beta [Bacteroidia bacterium]
MKISYNWLKNYVKTDLTPEEVAKLLTGVGLEVEVTEPFESIKGGLKDVVIGEVKTCAKHPNADRLSITTVDVGTKVLQIVCGASNVAAGQKVVVATEGAVLFPFQGESFQIKKSKIRGEASEGMICAEDEIGLGASHAGIMVLPPETKIGIQASDYFKIYTDTIFEINITPNRADAISHIGVARDLVAAINLGKLATITIQLPNVSQAVSGSGYDINVSIEDKEACPRYSGITIKGIKVQESPQWLRNYMLVIGLRPINNIVDVTNFVMHETGQPLHAFDADAISGKKVIVRKAKAGETMLTLDGVERKLHTDDLLICNEKEAMCIGGVYGGINSGVKDSTTNVFLESACFSASGIRKTARRHGLHTDAAYRFERGTDINGALFALKRAVDLIIETGGGIIGSDVKDIYPVKQEERQIEFSVAYGKRLIGHDVPAEEMLSIIEQVGIRILESKENTLKLSIPTHRMDITTQADIVEEIVRFYGFNNIPIGKSLRMPMVHSSDIQSHKVYDEIGDMLTSAGFTEIMNTSLTSSRFDKDSSAIKVANPLSSDLDVLRNSLLGNGLLCIAYNQNHQQSDMKFYEFGRTYHKGGSKPNSFKEDEHLSIWISGQKSPASWNVKPIATDFYQVKSYVNLVLQKLLGTISLEENKLEKTQFQAGLNYSHKSKPLADFGLVSSALLKAHDVKGEVYYGDFYWKNILSLIPDKLQIKEVVRFPHVVRDLSLIIDKNIEFNKLEQL